MAPKGSFKVGSLNKHIEDTKKGLSGDDQFNLRPGGRGLPASPKEAPKKTFWNNDDDDDDDDASSDDSSSSDGDESDIPAVAAPSTKPPAKDDEIADSDAGRRTSAQKATPAKNIKSDMENSDKSSDESSSDESESAVKATDLESSSESESDDDGDNSDAPSEVSTKSEAKAAEANERPNSGKETVVVEEPHVSDKTVPSSSSGEAADSASEHDELDREMADESIHIDDRQGASHVAPPNLIVPDFMLRQSNEGAHGEDVARICNQAQMEGKQFWTLRFHPKFPSRSFRTSRFRWILQSAESTMTPKSSIQILIPTVDGSQYQAGKFAQDCARIAQQPVEQVMQVRRITKLGGGDSALAAAGPEPKRSSVPQPKDLKASYQPSPIGNTGMDGEDCVMTDATPEPAAAAVQSGQVKSSKKKDKKKSRMVEASQEVAASRKGKRKHTTSEDDATAAAEQLIVESQEAESQSKRPKTGRSESLDLGSEPPSAAAKKETMVPPPSLPGPSSSMVTMPTVTDATTPTVLAKSGGKSAKKTNKTIEKTPLPSSSQSLPPKTVTPVPLPRQTHVPLPQRGLSSSARRESPVQAPRVPTVAASGRKSDKAKRRKGKESETQKAASNTDEKVATEERTETP
ncbi:hypothetical protein L249_0102 [Ophiocordyceps polyrhachis-furcata BCC 54312]|uniref:Uncharacterized protein n=1 Tax=Ophiocordyceps polyrhachis-furcata BCC 54312 TaxID=1330021 RepID=A0A367LEW0_9HYPO|nr:hypothetical protein L249_0102 [Ophiocordyceps polyrhachis-furcata BCC 54312]